MVMYDFLGLSGLGINKTNIIPTLFRKQEDKCHLAERLVIESCINFTLLGSDFDQCPEE